MLYYYVMRRFGMARSCDVMQCTISKREVMLCIAKVRRGKVRWSAVRWRDGVAWRGQVRSSLVLQRQRTVLCCNLVQRCRMVTLGLVRCMQRFGLAISDDVISMQW